MFPGNQVAQPIQYAPVAQPSAGDRFVRDATSIIQLATAAVTVVALGCAIYNSFNQPADPNRNRFDGYRG